MPMREDGSFSFYVQHRAAPQGSKTLDHGKNGKPFMRESSKGVHPFRVAVRRAAQGPSGKTAHRFFGPVVVSIEFEFLQPKSNQDDYPTARTIGDIDKLTRAVLDGLVEAKVIEDDSLVVDLDHVTKRWGPRDGAYISVRHPAEPSHIEPAATVDFAPLVERIAEAAGKPMDRWQRFVLDEVVRHTPEQLSVLSPEPPYIVCCSTVDHKSCLMFGSDSCLCPKHCPA